MSETKSASSKSIMILLSVMMFLQFWIWGSWYISIPTYIKSITHLNIGAHPWYAYTAVPIAAMIAPFFLGLFADRYFNTEKILGVLFLLSCATMFYLPVIGDMEGVIKPFSLDAKTTVDAMEVSFLGMTMWKHDLFDWGTLAHTLCFMPTLALTASLSFHHLKGGSKQFPLVRLWGTFGWIFAGLALPYLYNKYGIVDGKEIVTLKGESTTGQFTLAGWAAIALGVFCFFLPKTPAPKKGEKASIADLLFLDVWKEFKRPAFFVFVMCSFLLCIPLQAYYAFLQNQMGAQGMDNVTIWKNVGTWIEAGMMFAMPFFFRKLGVEKMIALGIAAWVFRYAMFPIAASYGVIPADAGTRISGFWIPFDNKAFLFLIAGIAVHGFCYDFFFVTGQIYVDQATNPKIRAQAQSMIVFFTQGLGMYIGAKINFSMLANNFGKVDNGTAASIELWPTFWWPLCIASAVILVIFLVAFKHKDKEDAELTH